MSEISTAMRSRLATVSLVCGIIGLMTIWIIRGLGIPIAVAGLLLGVATRIYVSGENAGNRGRGRSIAGISTAVIALLLAPFVPIILGSLLPAIMQIGEEPRRAACSNHLEEIGKAIHLYTGDHDGRFPTTGTPGESAESLSLLYDKYVSDPQVFTCPSSGDSISTTAEGTRFVLAENELSYYYLNGFGTTAQPHTPIAWDKGRNHYFAGRNVLFANGSTEWHSETSFVSLLARHIIINE